MNQIQIKSNAAELNTLFNFAAKTLSDNGITDKPLENNLYLCLDELFANVVSHAYTDSNVHDICFSLEVSTQIRKITLCVEDDGMPFNPLAAEPPNIDADINERQIGGLGLYIVSQIATDCAYERRDGKNVLCLQLGW